MTVKKVDSKSPERASDAHGPEMVPGTSGSRTEHFHEAVRATKEPFWGDDPFKGIPGAHGEDDLKF
jgi:hypothetical protein